MRYTCLVYWLLALDGQNGASKNASKMGPSWRSNFFPQKGPAEPKAKKGRLKMGPSRRYHFLTYKREPNPNETCPDLLRGFSHHHDKPRCLQQELTNHWRARSPHGPAIVVQHQPRHPILAFCSWVYFTIWCQTISCASPFVSKIVGSNSIHNIDEICWPNFPTLIPHWSLPIQSSKGSRRMSWATAAVAETLGKGNRKK